MTTYHVATTGDDGNSGADLGNAFLTISYADEQATDGDTIIVHPGNYNERVITTTPNITIEAYDSTKPVIWKAATADYQYVVGLKLGGVLDGFEVRESILADDAYVYNSRGIQVGGSSGSINKKHATVKNCEVHHTGGPGILAHYQEGLIVEDCEVYETAMVNYDGDWASDNGWWPGGNSFTRGRDYVIRNNHIWDVWGEAIPAGMGVYGLEIYGNTVGRTWSGKIYMTEVRDAYIYNNFLFNPAGHTRFNDGPDDGICITDEAYTQDVTDPYNVHFYNNICVDCGTGMWIAHGYNELNTKNVHFYNNTIVAIRAGNSAFAMQRQDYEDVTVKNNIFYVSTAATVTNGSFSSNVTFDRNIWSREPNPIAGGSNDIIDDPLLADPEAVIADSQLASFDTDDYKIQSTSPAIDHGDSQVADDFFGNARAGLVDLGAHEYSGDTQPSETDTAYDQAPAGLDGVHYDTELDGEPGRYFDGTAFVDVKAMAGDFDSENGGISIRAKLLASHYLDSKAHHIVEFYGWNSTTNKNNLVLIKQSEAQKRIDFVFTSEDVTVTIPYATDVTWWQTLGATWDDAGNVVAYVDGVAVGSKSHPGAWSIEPTFMRVGSGGGQYFLTGRASDLVSVRGETPTAGDMLAIHEMHIDGSIGTSELGALFTDYSWHDLEDKTEHDTPDELILEMSTDPDPATGAGPLTIEFDFSASTIPASDPVATDGYGVSYTGGSGEVSSTDTFDVIFSPSIPFTYTIYASITLESGRTIQRFYPDLVVVTDPTYTLPTYANTDDYNELLAGLTQLETVVDQLDDISP